jgi:hypothetical protein
MEEGGFGRIEEKKKCFMSIFPLKGDVFTFADALLMLESS